MMVFFGVFFLCVLFFCGWRTETKNVVFYLVGITTRIFLYYLNVMFGEMEFGFVLVGQVDCVAVFYYYAMDNFCFC